MLDLVFFPSGTSAGALLWNVASRLRAVGGDLGRRLGVVRAAAALFEVTVHSGGPQIQLDGDAWSRREDSGSGAMIVRCGPQRLRVLLPLHAGRSPAPGIAPAEAAGGLGPRNGRSIAH